nr:soma ferritin-like isoform X1 [Nomia melanderi]
MMEEYEVFINIHWIEENRIEETVTEISAGSGVKEKQAYYFDRSDVALPGLHVYFKGCSDEEREHGMKFLAYQNKRGGNISLTEIVGAPQNDWGSAKEAMMAALDLEKKVNQSLLDLHALASTHNDPNLVDFLETEFLQEQVDSIKEIACHVTNLERVAGGLGEYIFDKELKSSGLHDNK